MASAAREILAEPHLATEVAGIRLPPLQRRNLMLMLFIAQAIQMLSLVLIVFGFFVVFGSIAIRPSVIEAWVGSPPHYTGPFHLVSDELFSVAIFLSAFAGLYFTVQAVIDQNYRREFFTRIQDDLQRAIGVRKVYVALRAHLARTDRERLSPAADRPGIGSRREPPHLARHRHPARPRGSSCGPCRDSTSSAAAG